MIRIDQKILRKTTQIWGEEIQFRVAVGEYGEFVSLMGHRRSSRRIKCRGSMVYKLVLLKSKIIAKLDQYGQF